MRKMEAQLGFCCISLHLTVLVLRGDSHTKYVRSSFMVENLYLIILTILQILTVF
jgi:hypothetical protein